MLTELLIATKGGKFELFIKGNELHSDETQGRYDESDIAAAKKALTPDELERVYSMHANDGHKLGTAAPRDPYARNHELRNWTKQKASRTSQRAGR